MTDTSSWDRYAAMAETLQPYGGRAGAVDNTARALLTRYGVDSTSLAEEELYLLALIADRHVRQPEDAAGNTLLAEQLFGSRSPLLPPDERRIADSDKALARALEPYVKDEEANAALRTALEERLLPGIMARYGMTAPARLYDVRVVNLAAASDEFSPTRPNIGNLADYPDFRSFEEAERAFEDRIVPYLEAGEDFFSRHDTHAPAFALGTTGGTSTMYVFRGYAEQLIEEDRLRELAHKRGLSDEEFDYQISMARNYVTHEWPHTQGMLVAGDTAFGLFLEELRAEIATGHRNGYFPLYLFARQLEAVTGLDLVALVSTHPAQRTATEIYGEIVAHLGVEGALDLLILTPANYFDLTGVEAMQQLIGSMDTILARQLERRLALEPWDTVKARLAAYGTDFTADDIDIIRGTHGLNLVFDLCDAVERERPAAPVRQQAGRRSGPAGQGAAVGGVPAQPAPVPAEVSRHLRTALRPDRGSATTAVAGPG